VSAARAAIVLAAGHARRFGSDKLLAPLRGAPLIAHAIAAVRAAPVDQIVIVKRPGVALDAVCKAAAAEDARIACFDVESDAMSVSLRAGLAALQPGQSVFVFLGDMPDIPHTMADALAEALGEHFAAQPRFEGAPGHPVLLSPRAALLAEDLTGEAGAGPLLRAHAGEIAYLDAEDRGVARDIDTPADLAAFDDRLEKGG
jgi:molybdenum cofactor cytidylyltransferase